MNRFLRSLFFLMEEDAGGAGGGGADEAAAAAATAKVAADAAAGGDTFPTWMDQNKEDLKRNETLKQFASINDLSAAHLALIESAAEDSRVEIPKEDAGDDAWKAFWKKIGKPETYTVPEEVSKDTKFQGIDAMVDRLNLTETQATGLFEYLKGSKERENVVDVTRRKEEFASFVTTAKDPGNWGTDYDGNMANIEKFINTFGGDKLKQSINSLGVATNYSIMDAFSQVSRLLGPSFFTTGQITTPKPSKGLTYKTQI